jgi:class 3 adenylate cyclase/tetratricopeptide (TPR) repeat protein
MTEREQLEQAIAALEGQRALLGDAVVDAGIAPIRARLAVLSAPDSPPPQQRKLATILFMDIAGHTAIVRDLDPEETHDVIDRALARLARPIAARGGQVVRFQGDGFKAAFGLPVAGENDADNAVFAALDMLAEAERIAADLRQERGIDAFRIRIGIDTGTILAGGGTEGEDAVTGATVNLAARMEQAAEPGTILISSHTYQHVRGVFDMMALAPVEAKGFAEPVPVYRVQRAKPRSFRTHKRGIDSVETRMVGREQELRQLQQLYDEAVEGGAFRMATIVGEAGLGKSRLLAEFENWADLQPALIQLYRGRARAETQRLPYGLLRDLFVFRFGIHDDDTAAAARERFVDNYRATMGDSESVEMKAHLAGHLLGYDFSASPFIRPLLGAPRQLHDQALNAVIDYFLTATMTTPVMILLEDLHWADDSSLDVLAALPGHLGGRPVLIIGATRSSLSERRPDWLASIPSNRVIRLELLSGPDSRRLVDEVLQRVEDVPAHLRDFIADKADGNPFYLEELVKMLIEDGVIVTGSERWQVQPERLDAARVPPTLTGVLQARLESLPPAERVVLQQASVIGRQFWDTAVDHIAGSEGTARDVLPSLHAREIILSREGSAFDGTGEYAFKHALFRDVAYESVLRRLRRLYHQRAAEWLIKAGGERAGEYAEVIAGHYAQAGDAAGEARWLIRAGEQAAARFAQPEALRSLGRALELLPEDDWENRYRLLLAREQVYSLQGARAAQLADLEALDAIVSSLDDPARQALVALRRGRYLHAIGDFRVATACCLSAVTIAQAAGDPWLEAEAELTWSTGYLVQGEYAKAQEHLAQALALARMTGNVTVEAECLRISGIIAEEQGDIAGQERTFREALALARASHDRRAERRVLNSLAIVLQSLGDKDGARDLYMQSLAIARDIGDRQAEGLVLGNLGALLAEMGALAEAVPLHRQALAIAEQTGDRAGQANMLYNLGATYGLLGDAGPAVDYLQRALAIAEEIGSQLDIGYALNELGHMALLRGRPAEAADWFNRSLELRRELGQESLALQSCVGLAVARSEQGDHATALETLSEALAGIGTGAADSTEQSRAVALAVRVLRAAGDPRWRPLLDAARSSLLSRAETMNETSRRAFLRDSFWNRAILDMETAENG